MPIGAEADRGSTKRRRITGACSSCRSRKIKCDGADPRCSTCDASNTTCSYVRPNKKRGIPAGQYKRLLRYRSIAESIFGCLVSEVAGIESIISDVLAQITNHRSARVQSFQDTWKQSLLYQNLEQAIQNLDLPPLGHLSSELDIEHLPEPSLSLPPGSSACITLQRSDAGSDAERLRFTRTNNEGFNSTNEPCQNSDDISSILNPPQLMKSTTRSMRGENNELRLDSEFILGMNALNQLDIPQNSPVIQQTSPALFSWEPIVPKTTHGLQSSLIPTEAAELLETYFAHFHSMFPILNKIDVLQSFHKTKDGVSSNHEEAPTDEDTFTILLLCALTHPRYQDHPYLDTSLLHNSAIHHILKSLVSPPLRLSKMQTAILFSINLVQKEAFWMARQSITLLCDAMVRDTSFANALDQSEVLSDQEIKFRCRGWSSCFLMDTLIASELDVLPLLHDGNCNVPCVEENSLEEWETWTSLGNPVIRKSPARVVSIYNQFLKLTHIFNRLLTTLTVYSTAKDASKLRQHALTTLAAYDSFQGELKSWLKDLPIHLRDEIIFSGEDPRLINTDYRPVPYILNLGIAYHAFSAAVCKRLLRFHQFLRDTAVGPPTFNDALECLASSSKLVDKLASLFHDSYPTTTHPFLALLRRISKPSKPLDDLINQKIKATTSASGPLQPPRSISTNHLPLNGEVVADDNILFPEFNTVDFSEAVEQSSFDNLLAYPSDNNPTQFHKFMDRLRFVHSISEPQLPIKDSSKHMEGGSLTQGNGDPQAVEANLEDIFEEWILDSIGMWDNDPSLT